ncbi:hypothetical protein ONS95_008666 [Cadophora gregata]|uniref:uncharacterized protein n=1 Tax=Cadophora gregata TaxID=51156 RepID=UPI0026DCE967|nr:uncharacterized protein ONS95_008666 [Cadophora gregata]KAK0123654.1 hypothetical protein ONS95_008666 [Cadophora gregata]KAK0129996.1 hypothetical protein ONS96_000534 [Cadophora gregata f. sp. sojae]
MLFQQDTLALDFPRVEPVPNGKVVLVWGGASAVGTNGIQMLKAAGYRVAAIAGSNNQQYCTDLGANYAFDYRKPGVVAEIIQTLKNVPFAGVFCAVMAPETIKACARIASQLGDNSKNKVVVTSLAHSMKFEGEVPEGFPSSALVMIGNLGWADSLKDNEVGPAIWDRWLTPALENGTMKCRPEPGVVGKGLESIQGALDLQARGVSAKKLVVEIV